VEADIAVAEEVENKKQPINPKNAGSKSFLARHFFGNQPTGQYHYVLYIVDLQHFIPILKIIFSPLHYRKNSLYLSRRI
jgi:hypothetical protein